MSLNFSKKQIAIGLIILAAGESARMGEPKQLLSFEGETLLRRAAKTAIASVCGSTVVVLGANAGKLSGEITDLNLEIICNEEWKKGMSSSVNTGLNGLYKINDELKAVVVMVCDQPFTTTEIINNLVEKYAETNALIVASKYAETLGVPALFDKKLFDELKNLDKKGGAKTLIEKFRDQTVSIEFPAGNFDIDTPEDYSKLLQDGFLI